MAIQPSSMVIVAVVPFIVWRVYSRYRRLVGRQRSKPWRHWVSVVFFPLLLLALSLPLYLHPIALAALVGGIVVGSALGVFGLKHTRFEVTCEGYFFTPNSRIGIALLSLMVARIVYRFYEISTLTGGPGAAQTPDFARSPLTLAIIGMVASYYTVYGIGLLRWRARTMIPTETAPSESPP
jgi:hypothetical protein